MEIQKKGKKITIKHTLKRGETYKISQSDSFQTISIFKKPIWVTGVSNATEDGKYCIFIDYDNTSKEIVIEDTERLIREHNLPPFYLFSTKEEKGIGNYHLINLAKISYGGIKQILNECRCDDKYKSMNLRNPFKSWVLRISQKGKRGNPKFLELVGLHLGKYNYDVRISQAHLEFLNKIYKLPKIAYTNLDGGKKVKIHTYETFT